MVVGVVAEVFHKSCRHLFHGAAYAGKVQISSRSCLPTGFCHGRTKLSYPSALKDTYHTEDQGRI
eukprot:3670351-Amphidinium_carterae.1